MAAQERQATVTHEQSRGLGMLVSSARARTVTVGVSRQPEAQVQIQIYFTLLYFTGRACDLRRNGSCLPDSTTVLHPFRIC